MFKLRLALCLGANFYSHHVKFPAIRTHRWPRVQKRAPGDGAVMQRGAVPPGYMLVAHRLFYYSSSASRHVWTEQRGLRVRRNCAVLRNIGRRACVHNSATRHFFFFFLLSCAGDVYWRGCVPRGFDTYRALIPVTPLHIFGGRAPDVFAAYLDGCSSTPVSKSRVFFPWDGIAPHLEFPKRTRRGQAMLFLTTAIE